MSITPTVCVGVTCWGSGAWSYLCSDIVIAHAFVGIINGNSAAYNKPNIKGDQMNDTMFDFLKKKEFDRIEELSSKLKECLKTIDMLTAERDNAISELVNSNEKLTDITLLSKKISFQISKTNSLQSEINALNDDLKEKNNNIETILSERDEVVRGLEEVVNNSLSKINALSERIIEQNLQIEHLTQSAISAQKDKERIEKKYKEISDIESQTEELKSQYEINEKFFIEKKSQLLADYSSIEKKYQSSMEIYESLLAEVNLYKNDLDLLDYGLYEPIYNLNCADDYRGKIREIKERQKSVIASDKAAVCDANWTVNKSIAKGRLMTKRNIQITLSAFNGECDALIARVSWDNITKFSERIRNVFKRLNKLQEPNSVKITDEYLELKLMELNLVYEYELKRHQEKEEQRALKEEQREEQRALREIEQERIRAEREELYFSKALEKIHRDIESATGVKYDLLKEKLLYLEEQLQEAHNNKERAISMAQQTRRGYVYIISNIGSFGENVFKIGMTRRLDPIDRVRELSNASVPFRYDIHAMIFSEDAPSLENILHNKFEEQKVNVVNGRKEFFNVSVEDIEIAVRECGINADFIMVPEARDYRESISIKSRLNDDDMVCRSSNKYPSSLFDNLDNEESDD